MKFYVIDKKPKGSEKAERYRTDFMYDDSVVPGDAPKCPKCGSFVGMLESIPPYSVHLETWGEGFGDLCFWMNDFLASPRFRDEYNKSGLKGLSEFKRVTVLSHKKYAFIDERPPEYFRTIPKVGAARIDPIASAIEWRDSKRPTCELCLAGAGVLERWHHVVVDESSWSGEDIFYAYGLTGTLLVSSRFYEWANGHHFRNLAMKLSTESSHDFYPWTLKRKSEPTGM